ncbi:prepilin peptidase (plasmid) [Comamonadaceae bacterium OTU4NAUVB1]|nr:prepilin peptidase [Comamonadaceae bacterium OTU4NAUVB1]
MLFVALVLWLTGIVLTDFVKRRVPNRWLVVGAGLAFVALTWNASPLAVTWQDALTGGGVAFVVLLGFYALGMMGAGDVKFAAVLGLWLGGPPLVPIAVGAGLLAGGHALVCLARRHGPALLRRQRQAAGAMPASAPIAGHASANAPALDGAIPYAGYLALMALLWIALSLAPP